MPDGIVVNDPGRVRSGSNTLLVWELADSLNNLISGGRNTAVPGFWTPVCSAADCR
jgi:hypothetical protein